MTLVAIIDGNNDATLSELCTLLVPLRGSQKSKAVPGWGEYFPRFIYSDLRLNVIPPIPALTRLALEWVFPRLRNAHQERNKERGE